MVNTGHPSRACKLCRARRIRCDETKPFCLKCIKSKRVCPGYRDPFEINLRDETQSTIRKAKAAQKRKISVDERAKCEGEASSSASTTSSPGRTQSSHSDLSRKSSVSRASPSTALSVQDISGLNTAGVEYENPFDGTILGYHSEGCDLSLPPNLQTPLDQQATCYFLSQYVLMPATGGPGRGILTFLISLLNNPDVKNSPLPMAFAATSLAALAGRPNSRGLLTHASAYYSRALKEVNGALQNRDMALKDASLASVIMLSFYEGLAASDDPFTGWSNHLNGAKALIRLRSPEQIKASKEGIEMFEFVRSSMVRQYMFGFIASPSADEVKWWGESCVMDSVGHVALLLNMKTTLVRADADRLLVSGPRTSQKIEQALDLLRRAKDIMQELSKWIDNANPAFVKATAGYVPGAVGSGEDGGMVGDEDAEADADKLTAFPGRVFAFPNVWVAAKHLNTDASRVMLSGIIVRCIAWICAPSDHTTTAEYREAARVGREAVSNVVSSVPYFLSWTGDQVTMPMFPCGTTESPKGFAGISCLWPLFATGLSPFATRAQKKYIYGRLNWISQTMGIKPAGAFAKFIMKQLHPSMRTVDLGVLEPPGEYAMYTMV